MPPKSTEARKSILVIPSRVISRPDDLEGGEETEIAAQISIPPDGGWGWVVVTASFFCIFVLDGVAFTYGSMLQDIADDLNTSESLITLINSVALALYFIASPLVSAFINRYGFRACVMCGSVICSFSLLISYFTTNYSSLCVFYGVFAGCGYSMINLSCSLVVGFYFEKLRAISLGIASCGSSIGIMIMFPVNSYLVKISGWRSTTLLHSGLFGIIFFLGMIFRPLLSVTVTKSAADPTRTVTYLPNLSTAGMIRATPSRVKTEATNLAPTATERLFSAVSNANFPTAAAVVEDEIQASTSQPGTSSTPAISKLTLTANNPRGVMSRRQLKEVQSIVSRSSVNDKTIVEIEIPIEERKRGFWGRIFHWEKHVPQSRPMYRDDAFYGGKVDKLPAYQKSVMDTSIEAKTGLKYQLAVSRVAAATDLREKRGVFTTSVRRVLATMMDPKLLKKCSFLILCASGFLTYMGFLVPYIYLKDRNKSAGIADEHCSLFISAIGFANAFGRLVIGWIGGKIEPMKLFGFSLLTSGVSTIVSDLSFNVYYQYGYCCLFGFTISSVAVLRSIVLVSLYGLDKLTNATGMMLLFVGIASLISTPLASVLKTKFGYSIAFRVAGSCIALSGVLILPLSIIARKEMKKKSKTQNVPPIEKNVKIESPEKTNKNVKKEKK